MTNDIIVSSEFDRSLFIFIVDVDDDRHDAADCRTKRWYNWSTSSTLDANCYLNQWKSVDTNNRRTMNDRVHNDESRLISDEHFWMNDSEMNSVIGTSNHYRTTTMILFVWIDRFDSFSLYRSNSIDMWSTTTLVDTIDKHGTNACRRRCRDMTRCMIKSTRWTSTSYQHCNSIVIIDRSCLINQRFGSTWINRWDFVRYVRSFNDLADNVRVQDNEQLASKSLA
jgi:hypothetical protein